MKENPGVITFKHGGREQIYAFVQSDDGQLHVCFWDATPGITSWRWDNRNLLTTTRVNSSPSVISSIQNLNTPESSLHIFIRGNDGHLYEHFWNGTAWIPWIDHGQPHSLIPIIMSPRAVTFRGRYGDDDPLFDAVDRIFVFNLGNDGNLYRLLHKERLWRLHGHPPNGDPSAMIQLTGEPAVINHNSHIYAYAIGSDSNLYVNFSSDQAAQNWQWRNLLKPNNTPLILFSRASLVSFTHDHEFRIYAFARGGNGHLFNHFWQGLQQQGAGTWGDLGAPAGVTIASDPAAVTFLFQGTNRIYVFFRGSDDHLHIRFWDGLRWQWADLGRPTTNGHDIPATPEGGNTSVTSTPGVVTFKYIETNQTTDRIYAFIRGHDNRLHLCYWNGVDYWLWNDLGAS